ncbi:MAG: hypothetical protein K0Q94_5626, partial [Paenibacillus sp.]|nr:hypothetical protein [Paenibacillus sp.]
LDKDKERIAAGGGLNAYLDKLYKVKSEHDKQLQPFYNELDLQAQQTIIAQADLERITLQQLEDMKYMLGHHSQVLSDSLGAKEQAVFQILQCASFLLRNTGNKETDNYMTLSLLAPREIDQLQMLLQRLLKDSIRPDYYEKIAYAFYESGEEPGECTFSYAKMLDYVLRQSGHADDVYDFLNWSASYPYFLDVRGRIAWDFEGAIRGYFNKSERGSLNKRDVWTKLRGTPNRSFKKVYEEIRLAQSNPILRFIRKNRKILFQFGGIIVGVATLTLIGIYVFDSGDEPTEPVQQEQTGDQGGTGKVRPARSRRVRRVVRQVRSRRVRRAVRRVRRPVPGRAAQARRAPLAARRAAEASREARPPDPARAVAARRMLGASTKSELMLCILTSLGG